jgi:hypothetical protein
MLYFNDTNSVAQKLLYYSVVTSIEVAFVLLGGVRVVQESRFPPDRVLFFDTRLLRFSYSVKDMQDREGVRSSPSSPLESGFPSAPAFSFFFSLMKM